MRVIGHMQDVCALSKRQVVQEAGLEAPQHRLLPYRRKPNGGQCLQRNCCQDHPKVKQQKVSPWIGFYWPRMGSSLTSGGRLRRNTPAVCAIPVPLDSHGDQSIAMTKHRSDQVCGDTKC